MSEEEFKKMDRISRNDGMRPINALTEPKYFRRNDLDHSDMANKIS